MRIFSRTFFSFVFLIMTISSIAQLYKVPLDQRIQQSATIVEGQVVSSTSYLAADNNIYTAHKVRAFQLLKGNLQNPYFTVITYGGIAEGIQQTWTHLLTLQKEDIGVFFLIPTDRPFSEELLDGKTEVFEVYASSQGFLAYQENDNRAIMATAPFNYHPKEVLLQNIKQVTGQSIHINASGHPEDQTGVAYSFQNVTLSGNTLDFDIYVEGVWGSYDLVKSGILIEYDAAILGTNIAGSGALNVSKGTASASSAYNLTVTDVANDEVEIEIDAPNTGLTLHTITNLQEQLVHVQITAGAVGNPNIEFDEGNMQQLSDFLNSNNGVEAFQQVFAVGSVGDLGGGGMTPIITSVFPLYVAAGVDTQAVRPLGNGLPGVINIRGTGFGINDGVLPPFNSDVEFQNAGDGSAVWIKPFHGDYLTWTDTLIRVKVPSRVAADDKNYTASGPIRVRRPLGTDISQDTILIAFVARNSYHSDNGILESDMIRFSAADNIDGYELYFAHSLLNYPDASDAFLRALNTWRCFSLVNFEIRDSANIAIQSRACKISIEPLPSGVSSSYIAWTPITGTTNTYCLNGSDTMFVLRKFDIIFKNSIVWHTGIDDTTTLNWSTQFDFETTALHEIGHSHLLRHTNLVDNVMYPTSSDYKRDLWLGEIEGGLHTTRISDNTYCSGEPPMVLLNAVTCEQVSTQKIENQWNSFHIFPNPTIDNLMIEIDRFSQNRGNYQLEVCNILGQSMITNNFESNQYRLNVSSLSKGWYIIILKQDNRLIGSHKFLKF